MGLSNFRRMSELDSWPWSNPRPVRVWERNPRSWLANGLFPCGCREVSARLAVGRISYPIRRASVNICCNIGEPDDSEAPRPVHWRRSPTANMASDSQSSSAQEASIGWCTANVCSAGRWVCVGAVKLEKSVQTSIKVWSFLSFWVRIITQRYFLSSGSDCLLTNCSAIRSCLSSGGPCGYPTRHNSARASAKASASSWWPAVPAVKSGSERRHPWSWIKPVT